MVYVDASFRGRRDRATGIAALLVDDLQVRGRAVATTKAVSSFHAEAKAALFGLRLARSVPLARPPVMILVSDSEGLFHKINKGAFSARDAETRETMEQIQALIMNMHNDHIQFSCVHKKASEDQFLEQVDYLSKNFGLE